MKKNVSILATIALAAMLCATAFAQDPASQNPGSSPSSTMPQDPSTAPSAQSPGTNADVDSNVFTGTVVKAGRKYVLKTASDTYQLDDQQRAKRFEGKEVKVNGSLDKSTSVIHVTDIEPTSQS